jgi:hypothetical protein
MKKWYHVNKDVEYSTNLKFFVENQVACVINKEGYPEISIFSRLDGKVFLKSKDVLVNVVTCNVELKVPGLMAQVHKELLEGKFYPNGVLKD